MGHRLFQHLGDVVHRIREELVGEVVRHAVGEGRPAGMAVGAEEQACPLAPQVETDVGIAHEGKEAGVLFQRRDGSGDEVLVL